MSPTVLSRYDTKNIEGAGNHFRELRDPEVSFIVPYLMFDAFIDGNTRPNHLALDGGIAPTTWPGWNLCSPPLGRGCRCNLISITRPEAMRRLKEGGRYFNLVERGIPEGAGADAEWVRRDGWIERGEDPWPAEWYAAAEKE